MHDTNNNYISPQEESYQPMADYFDEQTIREILINGFGYIYASCIPIGPETPTLDVTELKNRRFYRKKSFVIKKYGEIYSDIKNRFEILDL